MTRMPDRIDEWRPGRSCPLHYRYPPSTFAREADLIADTLYVVGGLYGNRPALEAVLSMAAAELTPVRIVFNGDFHWFDANDDAFRAVDDTVRAHTAIRGNVETELASDDPAAGCGCGYPDAVSDADVARSNAILARLRETATRHPDRRARLASLPMHLVARVGTVRVGIVHGDAESLAGWGFDVAALDAPGAADRMSETFRAANVDGFASSHTCLPALREFACAGGTKWVANNGAAGMPNFGGTPFGVMTRISIHPLPPGGALYGLRQADVAVEAVALRYDQNRWLEEFLATWPAGTPAHESYHRRIVAGPAYALTQARRG
jgi:hypothetical protein